MKTSVLIAAAAAAVTFIGTIAVVTAKGAGKASHTQAAGHEDRQLIERGAYIARIGGCHDCHTPGYAAAAGKVDKSQWLVGEPVGWQGGWGTTYAANLRLFIDKMSEEQWLDFSRTFQTRPPMPWFNVHDMSEYDRKALYRFVRDLGPAGEMVPAYVPPGEKALTPVVAFPL